MSPEGRERPINREYSRQSAQGFVSPLGSVGGAEEQATWSVVMPEGARRAPGELRALFRPQGTFHIKQSSYYLSYR